MFFFDKDCIALQLLIIFGLWFNNSYLWAVYDYNICSQSMFLYIYKKEMIIDCDKKSPKIKQN